MSNFRIFSSRFDQFYRDTIKTDLFFTIRDLEPKHYTTSKILQLILELSSNWLQAKIEFPEKNNEKDNEFLDSMQSVDMVSYVSCR